MPGPAKPAVPVGHPCETPPSTLSLPSRPVALGRPGPAPREVSRWAEGGFKWGNRRPNHCFICPPPACACPACLAHPCFFRHPPILGKGNCPTFFWGWHFLLPQPLKTCSTKHPSCSSCFLCFSFIHSLIHLFGYSYYIHSATPTECLFNARQCSRHWEYHREQNMRMYCGGMHNGPRMMFSS